MALTLRSVCGLATAEIAAAFLVPERTMAQRLVRAKRKIRQAGISFGVPAGDYFAGRLAAVLRVVYLVFTEGHRASSGPVLVRGELCDEAIRLARALTRLVPDEPETAGLLALLLLTDARRDARVDAGGSLVLLEDQDRGRWDTGMIAEGEALLEAALRTGRPGPYQVHAAIAACHSAARHGLAADRRPVRRTAVLRAVPGGRGEPRGGGRHGVRPGRGPGDPGARRRHPRLARWPQLHIARAGLLSRLGRDEEARAAYQAALDLDPPPAERAHLERRLRG